MAGAVRAFLLGRTEVLAARESLRMGLFGDAELTAFVSDVLRGFRPGERLPDQMALAALAVALEGNYSPFAESFLDQLASSPLAELGPASHVARACLKHRGIESRSRVFCVGNGAGGQSYVIKFDANPAIIHRVEEGAHSGRFELSNA